MSNFRIRSIHHDAFKSRKLAQLSAEAERCWWRLQCLCDDDGRVEDEPDVFASMLFMVRRDIGGADVDKWLDEMAVVGLIERYEVDGVRCIQVAKWRTYQRPRRPQTSELPPPPVGPRPSSSRQSATERDEVPRRGTGVGGELETEGESEGEVEPPCDTGPPSTAPAAVKARLLALKASDEARSHLRAVQPMEESA